MRLMNKIYIGTSLFNGERAKQIASRFLDIGIEITYEWYKHGQVTNIDKLIAYGELEEKGVQDCDVFFMIQPGRAGTHCELY